MLYSTNIHVSPVTLNTKGESHSIIARGKIVLYTCSTNMHVSPVTLNKYLISYLFFLSCLFLNLCSRSNIQECYGIGYFPLVALEEQTYWLHADFYRVTIILLLSNVSFFSVYFLFWLGFQNFCWVLLPHHLSKQISFNQKI